MSADLDAVGCVTRTQHTRPTFHREQHKGPVGLIGDQRGLDRDADNFAAIDHGLMYIAPSNTACGIRKYGNVLACIHASGGVP
jgi:hypothetical protein